MSSIIKYPQTCASVSRSKTGWSNPDNVKASDDAYAVNLVNKLDESDWLRATNFDFSGIPAGSTIDGIEAKIEHHCGNAGVVFDGSVYLRKSSGQVGSNKASASYWPTSDAEVTYPVTGGATDKWGTTWTLAEIQNINFGIDLSALNGDVNAARNAYVDCISIRVYYTVVTFQPFRNYYPHILAH
jgi:hypothetical protein